VFVCVHHGRASHASQSPNEIRRPVRLSANRTWASIAAGATEYAARAAVRKCTPLDMAEDLAESARVATLRETPTWAHDAPEVRGWPVARLLDYSAPSGTTGVPTLVLPPQAGHASSIVDDGRDQSQMMTLRNGGSTCRPSIRSSCSRSPRTTSHRQSRCAHSPTWSRLQPSTYLVSVDAGHLGLFMGRAALAEHWMPIAERVRTYSQRSS
jgi:hypothetical protein